MLEFEVPRIRDNFVTHHTQLTDVHLQGWWTEDLILLLLDFDFICELESEWQKSPPAEAAAAAC